LTPFQVNHIFLADGGKHHLVYPLEIEIVSSHRRRSRDLELPPDLNLRKYHGNAQILPSHSNPPSR
jgi:hypothetical protein